MAPVVVPANAALAEVTKATDIEIASARDGANHGLCRNALRSTRKDRIREHVRPYIANPLYAECGMAYDLASGDINTFVEPRLVRRLERLRRLPFCTAPYSRTSTGERIGRGGFDSFPQ